MTWTVRLLSANDRLLGEVEMPTVPRVGEAVLYDGMDRSAGDFSARYVGRWTVTHVVWGLANKQVDLYVVPSEGAS